MEIYNHGCEHDGLYGFNPQVYDEMLRAGQRLYALATDDNHDTHPIGDPLNDSFGGFVQIAAKELTYPAVMEALQAGRFYWSQGPQILGLSIEGGALKVKTSPVEKIFVTVEGRNSYKGRGGPRREPDRGHLPPLREGGLVPRPGAGQPGPVRREQRLLHRPAVKSAAKKDAQAQAAWASFHFMIA